MENVCPTCEKAFKVKPSLAATKKYCSQKCRKNELTIDCFTCLKPVTRPSWKMLKEVYCCMDCANFGKRMRFRQMNIDLNPDRMTPEVRAKVRAAHMGKGEGKAYRKTYGVHTHRIVAAEKLGRPLLKGEVVHHIDENILNNHPDNLHVFASQAEHASHHAQERKNAKRK